MILYMEWSKSSRPVDDDAPDIEIISSSDSVSMELRDELELMKLKLEGLESRKDHIIRTLNEVTEAMELAKERCNGLDEICEAFSDRLASSTASYEKDKKACDEFEVKIKRDMNSAFVGELCVSIESKSEAELLEFINQKLTLSSDPDDFRLKIGSAYDLFRRKLKDSVKGLDQLKTTVHSLKKEISNKETQLIEVERNKLLAKKPAKIAPKTVPVVDRKTVPLVPVRTHFVDDLAYRKEKRGFSSLFGS